MKFLLILLSSIFVGNAYALPSTSSWTHSTVEEAVSHQNQRGTNIFNTLAPERIDEAQAQIQQASQGKSHLGAYHAQTTLINLPGRSRPLTLIASYTSQMWSMVRSENETVVEYNMDNDWPAPGWHIGFGRITDADLLVGIDHSRQKLLKIPTQGFQTSDGWAYVYHIPGNSVAKVVKCCSRNGFSKATFYSGDGTTISYYAPNATGEYNNYFPNRLIDQNGNHVDIIYRRDANGTDLAPAIESIKDTVGRTISFIYAGDLPVAIQGPSQDGQGTETYARIQFTSTTINFNTGSFCNKPRRAVTPLVTKLVLPLERVGTIYGYDSAGTGALSSIESLGDVEVDLNADGTVGGMRGPKLWDASFQLISSDTPGCLKHTPTFSKVHERWTDREWPRGFRERSIDFTQVEVDQQQIREQISGNAVERQFVSLTTDAARGRVAGQIFRIETSDRASGKILASKHYEWETGYPGSYGAPRLRSSRYQIDPTGRRKKTNYLYDSTFGSLIQQVHHFPYEDDAHPALNPFRIDWVTYVRSNAYLSKGLVNLVATKGVSLFGGGSSGPTVSSEHFEYDANELIPVGGIEQHLPSYEPTEVEVCQPRNPGICSMELQYVKLRGLLTRHTVFAGPISNSTPITTTFKHDSVGNVREIIDPDGRRTNFSYSARTRFGKPDSQSFGSGDLTLRHEYKYYQGTGQIQSITDPRGETTTYNYTRRKSNWVPTRVSSASATHETMFNDRLYSVTRQTTGVDGTSSRQVEKIDGYGRVRRTIVLDAEDQETTQQEITYDFAGRINARSRSYRRSSREEPVWTRMDFDALGRLTEVKTGDIRVVTYEHDSAEPIVAAALTYRPLGHTITIIGGSGNKKWIEKDSLDNVGLILEPTDASSDIFTGNPTVARYYYDAFGRLTSASFGSQRWLFVYDGLGRVIATSTPERQATLNSDGKFVGQGQFSEVYQYQGLQLRRVTDARGISKVFHYDNDPLGRLFRISYQRDASVDQSSEILRSPDLIVKYPQTGNINHPESISIDGLATIAQYINYNERYRTQELRFDIPTVPNVELRVDYDGMGRPKSMVYPNFGGVDGASRIDYTYNAGGMKSISLNGKPFVSNFDSIGGRFRKATIHNGSQEYELITGRDLRLGINGDYALAEKTTGHVLIRRRFGLIAVNGTGEQYIDGNIASETASDLSITNSVYAYDLLGRLRLVEAQSNDGLKMSRNTYLYDQYGNRTSSEAVALKRSCQACGWEPPQPDPSGIDGASTFSIDSGTNRIISPGFAYDASGNTIKAPLMIQGVITPVRFVYDEAGRLSEVWQEMPPSRLARLDYLLDTKPVLVTSALGQEISVLDGHQIISSATMDNTGRLSRQTDSIFAGEVKAGVVEKSVHQTAVHHVFSTLRGETARLGPGAGLSIIASLPYGSKVDGNNAPLIFGGHSELNETGLFHFGSRVYSNRLGRFLQVDPVFSNGHNLGSAQYLNRYAYSANNPISKIDMHGERWLTVIDKNCLEEHTEEWGLIVCSRTGWVMSPHNPEQPEGPLYKEYPTASDIIKERFKDYKDTGCGPETSFYDREINKNIIDFMSGSGGIMLYGVEKSHPAVAFLTAHFMMGFVAGTASDWISEAIDENYSKGLFVDFDNDIFNMVGYGPNPRDKIPAYSPPARNKSPEPFLPRLECAQ